MTNPLLNMYQWLTGKKDGKAALEGREKYFHTAFMIGLVLKGINAAAEIIGGLVFLFVSMGFISSFVYALTQDELLEDPNDFISGHLLHAAQGLSSGSEHFIAFYLLSHGIVKGFVIYELLKERLRIYPISMGLFGLFIIFQMFRFATTHSVWLIVLSLFDLALILLTWHEYKYKKAQLPPAKLS